jgi:hypothetical protein
MCNDPPLATLNLDLAIGQCGSERIGLKHELLLGSDMTLVEKLGLLVADSIDGECPLTLSILY